MPPRKEPAPPLDPVEREQVIENMRGRASRFGDRRATSHDSKGNHYAYLRIAKRSKCSIDQVERLVAIQGFQCPCGRLPDVVDVDPSGAPRGLVCLACSGVLRAVELGCKNDLAAQRRRLGKLSDYLATPPSRAARLRSRG